MGSQKLFLWPVVLVGTALVVAATMLFLLRSAPSEPLPTTSAPPPSPPQRASLPDDGFAASDFSSGRNPSEFTGQVPVPEEMTDVEVAVAPWEKPISDLLDSDDENDVVAAKLAALAPTLPLEGHIESIQHMVNLLDDEHYKLASDMVMNPALLPQVREVIFSDVLDRPNSVKVPVLLALLGSYGHPLQLEAREKMQLLLGADLGSDMGAWQVAAKQYLAASAAEEAAAESAADDFTESPPKEAE